jgi:DNA adenine methylase
MRAMGVEYPVVPFLKWPGGKRWLSTRLAVVARKVLAGTYYEPFLGGGALFFALLPERAVISDINSDLVNTYKATQDRAQEVIRRLKRLPVNKETYDRLRAEATDDPVRRAVRFLYLNRTAFGGIYRVNGSGRFNVPFGGGDRTPEVLWRRSLLIRASTALSGAEIRHDDFEPVINCAQRGDVVYCDPTYTVAHANNGFVRYNERNFSWADQVRLAGAARRASARGATVLVSNAEHICIRRLYSGALFQAVERQSLVSSDPRHRGRVTELLIRLEPRGR